MSTMNETIEKIASALGCETNRTFDVVLEMKDYPVALTKKSFVYQVSNAMKELGMVPNEVSVEALARRL